MSASEAGLVVGLAAAGATVYFLPALVATQRKHPQAGPIEVVNLLLGWTVVGWVVALAWAVAAVPKKRARR